MSASLLLQKPKTETVSAEKVPEVEAFLEADKRIQNLKEQYPGVFEELEELVRNRNTLLEAADTVVRARGVTCGPFNLYQYRTTFNAQAFYDAVGREEFLRLGGSIQNIPQYDIDKKKFEAFVAQGEIEEVIVKNVVSHGPSYKKPEKLIVP
jgi:hypothetical protein